MRRSAAFPWAHPTSVVGCAHLFSCESRTFDAARDLLHADLKGINDGSQVC
jgi:hypothetical protein